MHNTTQSQFTDDVLKPSYAAPVVVMFHASWCGPCKAMKPVVERLASEAPFTLVGVDGGAERALAASESIRGVPALLVYQNGAQIGQTMSGGKTEGQIREFLQLNGATATAEV